MDLDSVAVLKSLKTPWNSLLQLTNIAKTAYWTLPKDRLRWLLLTSQSPGNAIFHLVVGLQLSSIHTSMTHTSEHQHLVKNLLLSFSLDSMKQRHTYACSYHKYIWGLLQGSDTWWDEMMKLFSGKWHDQFNLFLFTHNLKICLSLLGPETTENFCALLEYGPWWLLQQHSKFGFNDLLFS